MRVLVFITRVIQPGWSSSLSSYAYTAAPNIHAVRDTALGLSWSSLCLLHELHIVASFHCGWLCLSILKPKPIESIQLC